MPSVSYLGLAVIDDGVAVDRRQQVLPVARAVGVGLNGRFRDRAVGIYRALFDSQQVPRCVVGVIVGLGNICIGTAAAVIVDLADELVLAVVLIDDQRIVGRGALRDLGDIPDIVVGILFPLQDRAAGADAHVAVLHLRRGLRNAACRAQILEGVGGRKERRAGSVFRCYIVQPFQSVIGIVQRVAGGGGHLGQAAVAACAVIVGVAFGVGRIANDPALRGQAVVGVVDMLPALDQGIVAVILGTADQSAKAVILKDIERQQVVVGIIAAHTGECALGIVGIFHIASSIIICLFDQPVKVVVGVADRLVVTVSHFGQIAAAIGRIRRIAYFFIFIGGKGRASYFHGSSLSPHVIGEIVGLYLRSSAALACARKRGEPAVGVGVADGGKLTRCVRQGRFGNAPRVVIGVRTCGVDDLLTA